nr:MAG TPA: hypothetical protein [Caudoviricetes sp.]
MISCLFICVFLHALKNYTRMNKEKQPVEKMM